MEYEVAQAGAESGVGEDRPERPLKVDRSFIEKQEGGLRTRAYVPTEEDEVLGNSGVTIGAGVDLGHQTEEGLDALEIDPAGTRFVLRHALAAPIEGTEKSHGVPVAGVLLERAMENSSLQGNTKTQ